MKLPATILAASTLVGLSAGAFASEWTIDSAHSSATFAVKHLMVSTVRGGFRDVKGTLVLDEQDVTKSRVDVTIDGRTIDTGIGKRDEHLRSSDFFDVEKFPAITFQSTSVEKGPGGDLKVTGDLTMRGVTKPVVLHVEPMAGAILDPYGRTVRGASATAVIDRRDWGLTWNSALEAGGVAVGHDVKLALDIEMALAKPPAAEQAATR